MKLCLFFPPNLANDGQAKQIGQSGIEVRIAGRTYSLLVIGVLWLGLLIAGFLDLAHEAYEPVPTGLLALSFPAHTQLTLDAKRPSLLLFAHPQCPCTKATFRELDRLRSQTNDGLAVTIIFTVPPSEPAQWVKGDLLTAAGKMTGIHTVIDNGGLARTFHVVGSGHVLVYTPAGRLLFSGGITPSRGHEGHTPGQDAIVRMAHGQLNSPLIQQPVYGCTLL